MQVQKEHYDFAKYVNDRRWVSYYYQIKECLNAVDSSDKSILLIGKGDGIVPAILRHIIGPDAIVDTFDFDENLAPDYVGDIRNISRIVNKKYDCIVCCQVLEHLQWEYFEGIIQDIKNICRHKFILSLPVKRYSILIRLDICHLTYRLVNIVVQRKWVKKFPFKGEHYWETGIKNHTKKDILNIIKQYYNVENEYIIPENTYHWFVICNTDSAKCPPL